MSNASGELSPVLEINLTLAPSILASSSSGGLGLSCLGGMNLEGGRLVKSVDRREAAGAGLALLSRSNDDCGDISALGNAIFFVTSALLCLFS